MAFFKTIKKYLRSLNPLALRKKFTWKALGMWILRVLLAIILIVLVMFAWYAKDLPTPGKIKRRQAVAATQIFDRNGNELYAVHGDIKRIIIEPKDIPESVKQATITAEDRNFYKHYGINYKSIARAFLYNLSHSDSMQGGSTITQQFVKNALLDSRRTFTRKIKEMILSLEIEIMYSKDEILTMYLNEIPYGTNAYGIEAASQTFFGKHTNELNLAESSTLAALPKAPTYYSPYGIHPDKRQARVDWILDSMADLDYLSRDQANITKRDASKLEFVPRQEIINAPHFVMYIKELLVEKYGEQMVEEGGFKVTTTLDSDIQKKAEESVKSGADRRFDNINASNAALTAIDPKTGQVLAMVGSKDFFDESIDGQVNVAISDRQPGSAFKPVVYAASFMKQYNPAFTLWDVTTDFGDYTPKNYDGTTHGPESMRRALAGSLNIPAVKTLYLVGLDQALDLAHKMGITTLNDRERYGLSLVLGGGEVKLLDLTTAYGVFANKGTLMPTTPILKIVDGNGKVLEEYQENKQNVLDPQIAYEINSILSDNEARSFIFGSRSALFLDDRPAAAKSGTTSEYRDAWTIGYTPSLVAGVWVGNNDNTPMEAGAAGAMAAAPIWNDFMTKAFEGKAAEEFEVPQGIQELTADKYTNKLPSGGETITDIFATWQIPTDRSSSVGKVRIDKYTDQVATDDCPDQFVEEKYFSDIHSEQPDNPDWENPVRAYAQSMGILVSSPPEGEETCAGLTNKVSVSIKSPVNNSNVTGIFTISANVESSVEVQTVNFMIDNISISTDSSKPYSISYDANKLSQGKHRISAVATDISGISASDSIIIDHTSNKNDLPPGSITIKSINPGPNYIDLSWKNPGDEDLKHVTIYLSTTRGVLGDVATKEAVQPNTTTSSRISSLLNAKTYYLTIRASDTAGNENTDSTQYETTTL